MSDSFSKKKNKTVKVERDSRKGKTTAYWLEEWGGKKKARERPRFVIYCCQSSASLLLDVAEEPGGKDSWNLCPWTREMLNFSYVFLHIYSSKSVITCEFKPLAAVLSYKSQGQWNLEIRPSETKLTITSTSSNYQAGHTERRFPRELYFSIHQLLIQI